MPPPLEKFELSMFGIRLSATGRLAIIVAALLAVALMTIPLVVRLLWA